MRILFVASPVVGTGQLASFQQADVATLKDLGFEVRVLTWKGRPVVDLALGARWADLAYCWNISDHAFLASYFAKKLVCAVGGYEFACIPELHYGNLISRPMRFLTKKVWRRADALLYVDPSLMDEATRAFGNPGKAHYVPTGYDATFWTPGDGIREDIVVTVCHAPVAERLRLKGVDLLLEAARACPDLEFHIAGQMPADLDSRALAPNVRLRGWLESDRLRDLYRRAKVYCQLSLHEGLPNAVCEAMLCGCVPVGTSVNGIPTAIGDAGYIVTRDPQSIIEGIRRALASENLRENARNRISSMFTQERRKEDLRKILRGLVDGT